MTRWIFFVLLLMSAPTFAKEAGIEAIERPLIKLVNDYDQILITIDAKGNVTLGDEVTLDEASQLFWQHVTTLYPELKAMLCER